MKKIITTLLLAASLSAFSQEKKDSKVDSVALWNNFLDSALRHTSINAFQNWIFENATVKQYQESKYIDLYQAYVNYQMQLFLKPKAQPKK